MVKEIHKLDVTFSLTQSLHIRFVPCQEKFFNLCVLFLIYLVAFQSCCGDCCCKCHWWLCDKESVTYQRL